MISKLNFPDQKCIRLVAAIAIDLDDIKKISNMRYGLDNYVVTRLKKMPKPSTK